MKIYWHLLVGLLLASVLSTQADLLGCDELSVIDVPVIGPKLETDEQRVRNVFKDWGCSIQKGVKKVGQKMRDLGSKMKDKMKSIGSDLTSKFHSFQDRMSHDSIEDDPKKYVEIIDPDVLKIEQLCGHGHILDALGNCHKLRK